MTPSEVTARRRLIVAANAALADERHRRERAESSELSLRTTLAFKDAIITDMHHRVSNTLHIAGSVLAVQGRTCSSAEAHTALLEAQGRLHVLAEVHQLLGLSAESTDEVSMPKLLRALAAALEQLFRTVSPHVGIWVECDPILLRADAAIPLALIANEAMTNAYQHAFVPGAAGRISVSLRRQSPGALTLEVVDDGGGISAGVAHNGLGLKLMRIFAGQLRGEITIAPNADSAGTTLRVTVTDAPCDRGAPTHDAANAAPHVDDRTPPPSER